MIKNYRKATRKNYRKSTRRNRKATRKANRKSRRNALRMRGGFQGEAMAAYKSPFVTNMVRY